MAKEEVRVRKDVPEEEELVEEVDVDDRTERSGGLGRGIGRGMGIDEEAPHRVSVVPRNP